MAPPSGSTVNDIRSMDAAGRSRSEIARVLRVSRDTVAKYSDMGRHAARRADAPEEGQARARGQRGMGRERPRGRPRDPEEAAPHRQVDLRQASRRARLRRLALHRAEARPRAQARPGGDGRGEAAVPGLRRRLQEAVGGNHHEPGVQQVGGRCSGTTRWSPP